MTRMGRFLPFVSALVWAAGAASCGGSGESPLASEEAGGRGATIRGTLQSGLAASDVSDASAASAAAGSIRVTVMGTNLSTTSDASGRFVLEGVPAGNVTLRFQAPGLDARVEIGGLAEGQVLTITVQVSGGSAVLLPSPSASASPSPSPSPGRQVEFEGRVESVTPLRVAGRTVVTDANTRIKRGDRTIGLVDIRVGDRAEVEGTLQVNGDVLARKIKIEDDENDDDNNDDDNGDEDQHEVELKGRIDSLTPPSLRVAGTNVLTDGGTRIERRGQRASLADFKVGEEVEVEGTRQDATVLAKKVKLED